MLNRWASNVQYGFLPSPLAFDYILYPSLRRTPAVSPCCIHLTQRGTGKFSCASSREAFTKGFSNAAARRSEQGPCIIHVHLHNLLSPHHGFITSTRKPSTLYRNASVWCTLYQIDETPWTHHLQLATALHMKCFHVQLWELHFIYNVLSWTARSLVEDRLVWLWLSGVCNHTAKQTVMDRSTSTTSRRTTQWLITLWQHQGLSGISSCAFIRAADGPEGHLQKYKMPVRLKAWCSLRNNHKDEHVKAAKCRFSNVITKPTFALKAGLIPILEEMLHL